MTDTLIKDRCEQGFSLIELVVAMGLIAVALTAVYHLQAKNLDLHTEARFATLASQMAKARLAEISRREELVEGSDKGTFEEDQGYDYPYSWEEIIKEVDDHNGLYQVRVRVFMQNNLGEISRDMVIETLLYRFGKKS
jgi:prepilin-type N-terminal cleavage/methylation domain-containing protein